MKLIKPTLFLLLLGACSLASAQNEISFTPANGPEFQDANGKILALATVGGFNQPQIFALDINNDGTKDVFVFDRSGNKVSALINDGTGKYTHHPELDNIFPKLSSWVIFRDFDADGKADMWFRDDQTQSISLYRNSTKAGDPHIMFTLVDDILRAYNHNDPPLDSSDLYCDQANIPGIEDVDGDGDIDFITLQKFGSGITLFRNVTVENSLPLGTPVFVEADVCWGDFQEGTTTNEIILKRSQWCYKKLKKHAGGSSLLLLDGDEDGDRDLILGNAGFDNLIYLNNGKANLSKQFDTMISYDPKFPSNSRQAKMMTFPAPFYSDINNDGVKDLVVAVNYTDKTSGYFRETENIFFYENTGKDNKPVFEIRDTNFLGSQTIDFGSHTAPVFWDMDGDGDMDLIIATNGDWGLTADKHDRLVLFENIGDKIEAKYRMAVNDYLGLEKDSISRMMPSIGDINKDGKPELIVGNVNGTLSLYNILGSGKTATASLVSRNAFNINVGTASTPHIADIDGDGDADLLVGCYEGNTFYYENTATGTVPSYTLATDTFGGLLANRLIYQTFYDQVRDTLYDSLVYYSIGYSSPFIADLDGNGDPEFILGTENGVIKIARDIRANKDSIFKAFETVNYLNGECMNYSVGSSSTPAVADLNNDGVKDLILGNTRGGIQFMQGNELCNSKKVSVRRISQNLRMYPNPTYDQITFEGLPFGGAQVEVVNISGQKVMGLNLEEGRNIKVSSLQAGIYFIQVSVNGEVFQGKFIKLN